MASDRGNNVWFIVILVLYLLVRIAEILFVQAALVFVQEAVLARAIGLFRRSAFSIPKWMSGSPLQTCSAPRRKPDALLKDPFRARWIGGRRYKHARYAFTDGGSSNSNDKLDINLSLRMTSHALCAIGLLIYSPQPLISICALVLNVPCLRHHDDLLCGVKS